MSQIVSCTMSEIFKKTHVKSIANEAENGQILWPASNQICPIIIPLKQFQSYLIRTQS